MPSSSTTKTDDGTIATVVPGVLDPRLVDLVAAGRGQVRDLQRALVPIHLELAGGNRSLRGRGRGEGRGLGRLPVAERVAGDSGDEQERDAEAGQRRAQGEAAEDGQREPAARLGGRRRRGCLLRGLALDDLHQAAAQLGRRIERRHGRGQHVDRRGQPADPLATGFAAGDVLGDPVRLALVERVEHVGGEIVVPAYPRVEVRSLMSPPEPISGVIASASCTLIFSRPSRIRPLTVPSGMPSISAISEWLKPPK